ncbi:hypothetical protein CMMCA002_11775 [Clavibacter michiganensis subsp. michiganensis]|nr:hypothetical protein CMMCA002_11775 [Clavibacter michiganensis subsp. michiganensis]
MDLGETGSDGHLHREPHGPTAQRVPHGDGRGRALPRDHAVARQAQRHLDAGRPHEVQQRDDPEGGAGPGDRDQLAPAERVPDGTRDDRGQRDDAAERRDDRDEAREGVARRGGCGLERGCDGGGIRGGGRATRPDRAHPPDRAPAAEGPATCDPAAARPPDAPACPSRGGAISMRICDSTLVA